MSYSFRSVVDGGADSDIIYYNALITASQTTDISVPVVNTAIRFNETRDAAIIKDASQYEFSIVRFAMNGVGKNLPLFIPLIQTNGRLFPNQSDPNLTIYYVTTAYQRGWNYTDASGNAQIAMVTLLPRSTPIKYISETQNTTVAPVPSVPATGIEKQDLSTRYYWVYSYKHWVQLVNNALLTAQNTLYIEFLAWWAAFVTDTGSTTACPYTTFESFLADQDTPVVSYDEVTGLFSIYGDTRCFNIASQLQLVAPTGTQPPIPNLAIPAYVTGQPASPATVCYMRLFFNDNLFGLLANFNNTYWGATGFGANNGLIMPLTGKFVYPLRGTAVNGLWLYTNEILFANQQYKNILNNNPGLQNQTAVPPPIYNPLFYLPPEKQNTYWIATQDYASTDSLWSPVAAIVFTSGLLPVKKEYTATPIQLGTGNASGSTGSPNTFDPIISDFILDQKVAGAEGWRNFTVYEPTAEYRMVSMTASHEEIRNIDIQVFWKYRLTGELIPLTMFNCSDVSMKMMFRKTNYHH